MSPSLGTSLTSVRRYFCLSRISLLCLLGDIVIVFCLR
ncbi:hypothetical protein LINGRAHAP2_LOCUS17053 [Linum grandiflorum]